MRSDFRPCRPPGTTLGVPFRHVYEAQHLCSTCGKLFHGYTLVYPKNVSWAAPPARQRLAGDERRQAGEALPIDASTYSQNWRGGVVALKPHPLRLPGESGAGRRPEGGRDFALRQYELKSSSTGRSGRGLGVFRWVTARKRHYVQRTVRRHIVLNVISYRIVYCISYRIIVLYIHTK